MIAALLVALAADAGTGTRAAGMLVGGRLWPMAHDMRDGRQGYEEAGGSKKGSSDMGNWNGVFVGICQLSWPCILVLSTQSAPSIWEVTTQRGNHKHEQKQNT